ncbi:MAG: hypothetical protein ACRDL0_05705, partial [Thermoleophilaceae bacterium]
MVSVLMLVATVVGTPGCELGVVSDLRFRLRRRTHQAEAMFCVVGLHKLDAWEARRAWCRH